MKRNKKQNEAVKKWIEQSVKIAFDSIKLLSTGKPN